MGYAREPALSEVKGKELLPGCPIHRSAKDGTESLGFMVEGTAFSPCNMRAGNKGFSFDRMHQESVSAPLVFLEETNNRKLSCKAAGPLSLTGSVPWLHISDGPLHSSQCPKGRGGSR
jgi:hypothetical protein